MRLIPALLAVFLALPAAAQQASPHAPHHQREIRSLSAEQAADLLAGRGMGLALAAELNGWPGPTHVLELAEQLGLSATQRRETETLMAAHRASAIALGAQLVEAERMLDQDFRNRSITAEGVTTQLARIGALQGSLRAEHLLTHLSQTALLTPQQIARYGELRGYAGGQAGRGQATGHRHRH